MRTTLPIALTCLCVALCCHERSVAADPELPAGLRTLQLQYKDDFETDSTARWEPTDPKAWRIERLGQTRVYSQFMRRSQYEPPVRSPYNRSLVRDVSVGDLVLDVKLQSTIPDYGHRDLCLFFGYQDASHFYYVHLGKKADDHANQIFIVNGKPRKKISIQSTPGTDWDDAWHRARVIREIDTGDIRVYFDDMQKPIMTARDRTFVWGRVGVGSFDDTGRFDDLRIHGRPATNRPKK